MSGCDGKVSLKKGLGEVTQHTAQHIFFMINKLRQGHPYAFRLFINKCLGFQDKIPELIIKILKKEKLMDCNEKISETIVKVTKASINIKDELIIIDNPIKGESIK